MKPDLFKIGKFVIHGYGFMIALGFLTAFTVAVTRAKKRGLDEVAAGELTMLAVVLGFIGAKILYAVVNFKKFLETPMQVLGSSGFVVYGGIITGIAAGIWYCHRKGIGFLQYLDLLIPEVAIAQGFGRIGCYLAGCCYGIVTDSRFSVVFPAGSMAPAGVPLIPTQLISAAGDFVIAAILLTAARRKGGLFSKNGSIGALYMILYSIGRFVIEFFRADARGTVGILSTSQFISIFFVLAGIILLTVIKRNPKKDIETNSED